MHTNSFNARTIDKAVDLIMDMENHSQVFKLDNEQPNLRRINVRGSYDRVPESPSRGCGDNDWDLATN